MDGSKTTVLTGRRYETSVHRHFSVLVVVSTRSQVSAQTTPPPTPGDRTRAEARQAYRRTAQAGWRFQGCFGRLNKHITLTPLIRSHSFMRVWWRQSWKTGQPRSDITRRCVTLDNTSDDYVQAQVKLDDARKFLNLDSTPSGKQKRKFDAAEIAIQAADAAKRAGQLTMRRRNTPWRSPYSDKQQI